MKSKELKKEIKEDLGIAVPHTIKFAPGTGRAPVKEGIMKYFEERDEKDIDALDLIVKALEHNGLTNYVTSLTTDPAVMVLGDKKSDVQRMMINRHYRLQALTCVCKTGTSVLPVLREFFDGGPIETWLLRFYDQVIPFFKKHDIYKS